MKSYGISKTILQIVFAEKERFAKPFYGSVISGGFVNPPGAAG